jgi:hypothetical protein
VIPLYGFLQGDTMGLLVLARDDERVATLGERLQQSASVRVRPMARFAVIHRGRELALDATVKEVGLAPLDRFDVVEARSS